MEKYNKTFLKKAHKESIYHEAQILKGKMCGCFYCKTTFSKEQITEWVDINSPKGKTAICPKCGIDSVLGDNYPVEDKHFLQKMNKYWF